MPLLAIPRPRANPLRVALLALLALTLVFAAEAAAGQPTKRVAKAAENATLGHAVLTTTRGRTLYSLSVEKHGKFICTGSCLTTWKPLTVPAGTKPTGPVKLGTIKRPLQSMPQQVDTSRPGAFLVRRIRSSPGFAALNRPRDCPAPVRGSKGAAHFLLASRRRLLPVHELQCCHDREDLSAR